MSFNHAELARTLFEEAADALFLFDPLTENIVDVNPMGLRLSGFTRREVLAMQLSYLLRSEEQGGSTRLRAAFKKTGLFHSQEGYVLRSAEGGWIPVNLSVTRLHAEPKTLALITARDVREQRSARVQLEKAEAALRRVLASVADAIWSAERDRHGAWTNLYYSPVVERITGRPPAFFEAGMYRWLSTLHPDDRPRIEQSLATLRGGQVNKAVEEYRILLPDGAVRWVRDSIMVSNPGDGLALRLDGVVSDVTASRLAEDALRHSEDRLASIVETVADGLCILDKTGRITFANAAAERIFGLPRGDFIDRTFNDSRWNASRVDGKPLTEADFAFPRVLATRQPIYGIERAFLRPDGQRIIVSFSASPMLDGAGNVVNMVSSFTDVSERHHTEAALRQSEERFQLFMNNSPAVAFIKDEAGRYVYGNQSWADQFGAAPAELLGKTDFDLWPEETARLFQVSDREALAAGRTCATTETGLLPDGSERAWMVLKFPLHDGKDRPLLGGMVVDVSDRKRAEDQERMARQLLGAISHAQARFIEDEQSDRVFAGLLDDLLELTHSTFGFIAEVHWNADGQPYLRVQALAGLAQEGPQRKAGNKPSQDELPSGDVYDLFGQVVTTGQPLIDNTAVPEGRLPGCPLLHARLGLPFFHGGDLVGMVGIANRPGGYDAGLVEYLQPFLTTCANIIEAYHNERRRSQAEEALRASETKYRTLIDNLQQCVFLKDARLRFMAVNAQFCRFANIAEEELLGHSDFDFYPRELAEKYRADDLRVLAGERLELEEQNLAQGHMLSVRVVKTPVRDSSGRIIGVLGIFWDVTEQRQLEAQLQQAQKMEAIGQLAGGVAHDFNNLLQAILGNLALVVPSLSSDDPDRILLQSAERASQRAAELVRQLLGFSRRSILRLEPLILNVGVQETIGLLERAIDPRITIEHRAAPDLWHVHADLGQMNQVLMNLCLNARDAMPEGGRLSIETQNVTVGEDYVRGHLGARAGEFVRLTVRDTGHGMAADVRSRVFEPFFTTKGKDKGTGLGLAMVLGIVEQHQGWITCQSEPGRGTVFQIHLPRHVHQPVTDVAPLKTTGAASHGHETILFVDDEAVVRSLGKTILQRFGYHVILAEDGLQAIDTYRAQTEQIDLVILDMTMPRLSGRDTLQELLRVDANVKVILSSGYSAELPPPEEYGRAHGFIGKPYRPEELRKLVRDVLDHRQSEQRRLAAMCNGEAH